MGYTKETPFAEWFAELKRIPICELALNYCQNVLNKNEDLTVGDFANKVAKEDEAELSWATWVLETFGKKLSKEVRKRFIKKIKDPMMAFQFYLKTEFLTNEEDALLAERFEGRLPQAEMELRIGIVKRRKV